MKVGIYDLYLKKNHMPYLAKISETSITGSEQLLTTKGAAVLLRNLFNADKLCEERMWMVCVNTQLIPVGIFEICHGNGNSATVSSKAICQRAMLCNANAVIVAHNHPSGSTLPSEADKKTTKSIEKALKLCEIMLLDHVIIGGLNNCKYYSFKENGLLK